MNVLSNLLICLSMDESSHEQFNSAELEFMALNVHSSQQSALMCSEVRRCPHKSSGCTISLHLMYHLIY